MVPPAWYLSQNLRVYIASLLYSYGVQLLYTRTQNRPKIRCTCIIFLSHWPKPWPSCCHCGMKLKKHSVIHASTYVAIARCHNYAIWSKLQNLTCWHEYIWYRKPDHAGWYQDCWGMEISTWLFPINASVLLRARLWYLLPLSLVAIDLALVNDYMHR